MKPTILASVLFAASPIFALKPLEVHSIELVGDLATVNAEILLVDPNTSPDLVACVPRFSVLENLLMDHLLYPNCYPDSSLRSNMTPLGSTSDGYLFTFAEDHYLGTLAIHALDLHCSGSPIHFCLIKGPTPIIVPVKPNGLKRDASGNIRENRSPKTVSTAIDTRTWSNDAPMKGKRSIQRSQQKPLGFPPSSFPPFELTNLVIYEKVDTDTSRLLTFIYVEISERTIPDPSTSTAMCEHVLLDSPAPQWRLCPMSANFGTYSSRVTDFVSFSNFTLEVRHLYSGDVTAIGTHRFSPADLRCTGPAAATAKTCKTCRRCQGAQIGPDQLKRDGYVHQAWQKAAEGHSRCELASEPLLLEMRRG